MKGLQLIQQKLNAPKDKYNSFGKYKYRSCEGILMAVKPLLEETKSTLYITDDIVEIGGRIYVKAKVTFIDEDGSQVEVTGFAREADTKSGMDTAQVTGAASSYARKYALNALFLIDDAVDPDTDEYTRVAQQKQSKPTAASKQVVAAGNNKDTNLFQSEPMPTITLAGLTDSTQRIGAVRNAVAICKSLKALNNLFANIKAQDTDLADLMKPEFTKRKQELNGGKETNTGANNNNMQ